MKIWALVLMLASVASAQTINPSPGSGGPPSGAAGGDLSGTYPNPTVANLSNLTSPATAQDTLNGTASTLVNPLNFVRVYDINNTPGASYKPQNQYGFNLDPNLLPHLVGCMARVRANTGDCRILLAGDSTTFSTYCTGSTTGDFSVCSYPHRLAQYLNAIGIAATDDSWMGDGTSFEKSCVNDGRLNCGGWTQQAATSIGGDLIGASSAVADVVFSPRNAVDSFRVWYTTFSTNGTFTAACDSNTATSISTAAATSITSTTITCPTPGIHKVTLHWSSGGAVAVAGVEAFNSTQHSVRIINAGWAGAITSDWTVNGVAYNPLPAVATFGADVDIVDLGINDWRNNTTTAAQYKVLQQTQITAWKAASDVIIETPLASNVNYSAFSTQINQNAFVTAMYENAVANSIPIIDQWSRGTYAVRSVSPFFFYGDTAASPPGLHGSATGYGDFASNIVNVLSNVLGFGSQGGAGNQSFTSTVTIANAATTSSTLTFPFTFPTIPNCLADIPNITPSAKQALSGIAVTSTTSSASITLGTAAASNLIAYITCYRQN